MSPTYPAQYLEGLRHFNRREFFESHEVLEELWQETHDERRKFYQGLIQAAVALHHFENGNLGGARKVYLSARNYLGAYPPEYEGLSVIDLVVALDLCFEQLGEAADPYAEGVTLQETLVPQISLAGADVT